MQGVGFRPFTVRTAYRYGITGSVKNLGGTVDIKAAGDSRSLDAFASELLNNAPVNSLIVHHDITDIPAQRFAAFTIEPSEDTRGLVFMSPDIAACGDCMREFADKNDARYLHPFISCMSCGPRYSVIEQSPYDRETTTMRDFDMCRMCESQYGDRRDRRYHAQTISCHDCGPYLLFADKNGKTTERDAAFSGATRILGSGGIIAVKGIGGYHIVCSPFNEDTVLRLRDMKRREQKPFAVMFPGLDDVKRQCRVAALEEQLLLSRARPIVLLEKDGCTLARSVCNKSRFVGSFLPYTPLQYMLVRECGPLIMTSANISEEPIIRDDEEMLAWTGLDGVLYNQRRIAVSLDDSVVKAADGKAQMIRRSRGYAPLPVILRGFEGSRPVFAAGGMLKSSFCLTTGQFAYISQHVGDLDNERCLNVYRDGFERMKRIFRIEPEFAVCDAHPAYASTSFAKSLGLPVLEAQHHHAHIASVMAEHGVEGPVIGVAFDGTGYGPDGAVWGGEFLVCQGDTYERAGRLGYISSTGGDEMMKDAAKSAMFHLYAAGLEDRIRDERWPVLKAAIDSDINVYKSSSMGRLFDAVSSIAGVCSYNRFEGECAIDLENLAAEALRLGISPRSIRFEIEESDGALLADASPVIAGVSTAGDADKRSLALGFHYAVAEMTEKMCEGIRDKYGVNTVALSGGVFQNSVLLGGVTRLLKENRFIVYINESVPPNDGGISLGQAYIGLKYLQREGATCA